jgi:hypothetical protein
VLGCTSGWYYLAACFGAPVLMPVASSIIVWRRAGAGLENQNWHLSRPSHGETANPLVGTKQIPLYY